MDVFHINWISKLERWQGAEYSRLICHFTNSRKIKSSSFVPLTIWPLALDLHELWYRKTEYHLPLTRCSCSNSSRSLVGNEQQTARRMMSDWSHWQPQSEIVKLEHTDVPYFLFYKWETGKTWRKMKASEIQFYTSNMSDAKNQS
jgi:hypothetical protein